MQTLESYVRQIVKQLGLDNKIRPAVGVTGVIETDVCCMNGVKVSVQFSKFGNSDGIRVEVDFALPEDGVLANTYIEYCGKADKLPQNEEGRFFCGPKYPSYAAGLLKKHTTVYSPWNNRYFVVESMYYKWDEANDAVANVIRLAKPFIAHLCDLQKLRYWKTDDNEVIKKAREIVANADFIEEDVDREERAHWLRDRNSFVRGWFYPLNDRERGTFDTLWPSSVDYAAKTMGEEGSFEYAVSCLVLVDSELIAKARNACRIRKKTMKVRY